MIFDITFILTSGEVNYLCSAVINADTWNYAMAQLVSLCAKSHAQPVSITARVILPKDPTKL